MADADQMAQMQMQMQQMLMQTQQQSQQTQSQLSLSGIKSINLAMDPLAESQQIRQNATKQAIDPLTELQEMISQKEILFRAFEKIDVGDNYDIELEEFRTGMHKFKVSLTDDELEQVFNLMDCDTSNFIDRVEFVMFLRQDFQSNVLQRFRDCILKKVSDFYIFCFFGGGKIIEHVDDNKMSNPRKTVQYKYELLVSGYIHTVQKEQNIQQIIPTTINEVIISFVPKSKLLKFRTKYKTSKSVLNVNDDKTIVTKIGDNHTWECIVCDIPAISSGIHCWRLCVYNPRSTNQIFWGISQHEPFLNPNLSFDDKTFWGQISNGVTRGDGVYGNDGFSIPSSTAKYQIDILLNCSKRTLETGLVNTKLSNNQYIYDSFPKTDRYVSKKMQFIIPKDKFEQNGWVPHFILYENDTVYKVAEIDPQMFMIHDDWVQQLFDNNATIDD